MVGAHALPPHLVSVCVCLSFPASAQTLGSQYLSRPQPSLPSPGTRCIWHPGLSYFWASLTWASVTPPTADALQTHSTVFQEHAAPSSPETAPTSRGFRRASEVSIASQVSGMAESYTASSIAQSEYCFLYHPP